MNPHKLQNPIFMSIIHSAKLIAVQEVRLLPSVTQGLLLDLLEASVDRTWMVGTRGVFCDARLPIMNQSIRHEAEQNGMRNVL